MLGKPFCPVTLAMGSLGGPRPVQVMEGRRMGLPLDGASTLGGQTPLTWVGVMGHDVPGRDEAGSSQQGWPAEVTGSNDPHIPARRCLAYSIW